MDSTISPNINSININSLSSSSSQSNLISELLKQQQISHQQPPPDFINSINELRELSTALSAFLHDFDDLRNHITSISSAIDAQLPPHLLLNTTTTSEAIFAERNPNGTEKGNGDLRHVNKGDDDDLRKVLEETDAKLEGIDVVLKESVSLVSEEDIDIWKMIEDIDCDDDHAVSMKKKKRKADIIDKINVLLKKEPEKSETFRKAEGIDKLKEREGTDISKEEEEDREINVAEKKKKHEENDVSKEDGEIEILKDGEIDILKEEDREIDVSKKKKPKEIDISKKHKETEIYREADEIHISMKKQEEIRSSKRKREEIDEAKKQHEEIDKSKHEESDNFKKKKDEEIDISKKHDETDAFKRPAEINVSKKPEMSDTLWKPEVEIDILMKPKERETSNEDGEDDTFKRPAENDASKKPEKIDVSKKPQEEIDASKKPVEVDVLNKPEEIDASKKPAIAMLELLCKEMCAKEMKQHVLAHLSEMNSLHQEIAKALKLAINPAKLVLDSIGRVFLKSAGRALGSMHKKSAARQVVVLILECFVMISGDGIEITKEDKLFAKTTAIAWRKRKIKDGGLIYMEAIDARVLLLFISGFGIPDGFFSNKDLRDLIRASNVKEISNALRHSTILIPKLPEVIDWMVKNNLEIEAADTAYTFGLENKCHKPQEETDASQKTLEIDLLNKPEEVDALNKPEEIDVSKKPDEIDVSNKAEEIDVSNKPEEIDVSNKADDIDTSQKPAIAVLEFLCKRMRAKKMKRHLKAHISEMNSLQQEIAKALKLAKNPANLVLNCIGRFFLLSGRAWGYKRTRFAARQATLLILECFVMISGDGIKITKGDKEFAENAAFNWRKRMIKEGGLILTEADDARGLLLFISGFGIPDGVFSNEDFRDLIRASNVKEISNALRHSTILIPKLPEVIDWMVKNNLEIEAADIAYTFALENKCHKPQEETDASKKTVEIDVLNQPEEVDVLNKAEEIDVSKKPQEEADASKKTVEIDVLDKPEEIDVSKKPNEIDVSNKPEEIGVSKKPQEEADASKKTVEIDASKKPDEIDVLKKPDEIDVSRKPVEIGVSNTPEEICVSNKADEIDAPKNSAIAVLELLCKEMRAKEMKWHVLAHISEMNSLHQEIAKALKLAINPAKLVLDSIGRFFLQTTIAYYNGEFRHKQMPIRQAAVLILKCFVMISGDGIEITKEDKEYAENAAIDWRKRMIKEGGMILMEADDARGLLLFISGFGIPDGVFSNEDFWDLIRASNVKEISNVLRHSTILIPKLTEVIDWMVKNNLEFEAADIAYTFGLEDKCHPETILTFLYNKIKDTQNGSSLQVNAATMQQLSDLKSIRRCLDIHKIDLSKINEKIEQLEKVINEPELKSTEEKSTLKRKEKETEFSKDLNHQQAKRICFSHENLPHEQNPHDHYGIRPYNRSTQPSCSYVVTTYSASSATVFSAPVLTPNTTSSVPGGLAGSYSPGVYGGPVVEPMVPTNNPRPYGWHRGQPYSRQSQAYGPYPSTADFYGRPPWRAPAELYPGLPDHSLPGGFLARHVPSSDLYRFVDTVVERGSHHGPRAVGSSTTLSS